MSVITQNPWIKNWQARPQASFRLFCFPHVGGASSLYRLWPSLLDERIELIAVELPGRGKRFGETPFTSIESLLNAFNPSILPLLDKPFFIFGHSMGALMAYEWARLLRNEGHKLPIALFLSAFEAPHIAKRPKIPLHTMPNSELIQELEKLGGTPPEVLKHLELMELLLPVLRADLQIVENYSYKESSPLEIPFHILGGCQDKEVEEKNLETWRELTASSFQKTMMEGDHFFIHTAREQILNSMGQVLDDYISRKSF